MGDEQAQGGDAAASFERFRAVVREQVDTRLRAWLDARVEAVRPYGEDLVAVVDAVRSLSLRGGKRLRAVLLAAAYEGLGGEGGAANAVMGGVALELLQTYLLIHDDWMDDDDVRRGGPTVHAMLRDRFASTQVGASAAILAGDLACAYAQQALLEVPAKPEASRRAIRELAKVQEEVVYGQLRDVRAVATTPEEVETTHALKTASYTVRGPLVMGAALAGADEATLEALTRFAMPLGIAFQLRDDLLGVFGDPKTTGKPAGSDLRKGKQTALVVELSKDPEGERLLGRVLGVEDASEEEIEAVKRCMERSGAKGRVEARLEARSREAAAALEAAPLSPRGRAILAGAVKALGNREH